MVPVPSYQVVQFLDWLHRREVRLSIEGFDSKRLLRMAREYMTTEEAFQRCPGSVDLELIIRVFQACPMIQEEEVVAQMGHFARCGSCFGHIPGPDHIPVSIHPLLRQFVTYADENGFSYWVREALNERYDSPRHVRDFFRMRDLFPYAIHRVGSRLEDEFRFFVERCSCTLVRSYEIKKRSTSGREGRPKGQHPDHGAEPITPIESPEQAAGRLVHSVQALLRGGYYDQAIAGAPQLYRFLALATDLPTDLAQSLEFLAWVLDQQPELDIAGDIPSEQIAALVQAFCEANNYSNAASFGRTVESWMSGVASETTLQRLWRFVRRHRRHRFTSRSGVAPFRRYQSVRMHGMFLFLSTGDFPSFIDKHWRDLNALTGDALDVYFSKEDLKKRVSGYETLAEFKSLSVPVVQLPGLVLWERDLKDAQAVPLAGLRHDDIVEVMKRVVHRIGEGDRLEEVVRSATDFVFSLLEERRSSVSEWVRTKIVINGGDNIMGDRNDIDISGGQVGAIGAHAHAHDMTFNQIWHDQSKKLELPILAEELSRLRGALRNEPSTSENDAAMGAVANAEISAQQGDGPKALEYLKSAGKVALSCAEKIGSGVAVAAIKAALGI